MLALDDGGLEAELRRADRRDIAAWAAADDEDVVRISHLYTHTSIATGFSM